MHKYYEVVVSLKIESENSRGDVKVKNLKEVYLVDAMSITEAEAKVVELFKNFSQEFSVVSIRGSKIIEVVTPESKTPSYSLNTKNNISKDEDKDLEEE
jgi:phosphoribosylaminoimidazole carboxylase (NCAIR synthetase)